MNNENPNIEKSTKTTQSASSAQGNNSLNKSLFISGYVILVVIIGLLGYYVMKQQKTEKLSVAQISTLESKIKNTEKELSDLKESTGENNIDKSAYQAVFFKGGQVYFGKITKINETQITLTKIYYLQVSNNTKPDINNLPTDARLIKLGSELHGPQDVMYIERKEVEFWENLKNDGQVAKAIATYEKANPTSN